MSYGNGSSTDAPGTRNQYVVENSAALSPLLE